jgi:tetratricopeptide (TPR) repeat protein
MPDPALPGPAERSTAAASERLALAEDLVDAALAGLRQGALEPLVLQRPRAARWLMRHLRPVLRGTVGDALGPQGNLAVEAAWLLRWAVTQLRPDQQPQLDGIAPEDWLHRPAWRPMLAVMCHSRMATVPDFPGHYRRRPEESPADNLCGLWGVDPSTFYRYVERGQRAMVRLAMDLPTVPRRFGLRRYVLAQLTLVCRWSGEAERAAWHRAQAVSLQRAGDAASALWHAWQSGDAALAVQVLLQHAAVLAGDPEVDALVERVASLDLSQRQLFDLWHARAALARTRQAPEHEETACRQLLQLAETARDDLWRGIAQCALGRCFEGRDAARAFAYYEESLRCLARVEAGADSRPVQAARLNTLARVAHMRVRRNDPGAREVLEEGSRLLEALGAPDEQAGLLEQGWAAYWRAAGNHERALQCRLRALNIFERIGDRRSMLVAQVNLMVVYAEMRDVARVEAFAQRVLDEAKQHAVEPGIVIGTHGNLGTAYSHVGRYETAIEHFRRALDLAVAARQDQFANIARNNLANAYYNRYLETNDATYERLGDDEVDRLLRAPLTTLTPSLIEEARGLKAHVLGRQPERSIDQLLDDESAAHLPEMSEVKRQRLALAAAGTDAAAQVEARLGITRAYLTIASKEREVARDLAARHALQERFQADFDALRRTFDRELTREEQLSAAWKLSAADVLDDARRAALVAHLVQDGSVNKSTYVELCSVAPATASKHLVTLAERGLLVQRGKGPSTRYELPA